LGGVFGGLDEGGDAAAVLVEMGGDMGQEGVGLIGKDRRTLHQPRQG
jgi:hypothetical protein